MVLFKSNKIFTVSKFWQKTVLNSGAANENWWLPTAVLWWKFSRSWVNEQSIHSIGMTVIQQTGNATGHVHDQNTVSTFQLDPELNR